MADTTRGSGFAEFLRELKDRSGHSYGTLAKRLHMSTSTLHRYCNGDAVPTDYAPVERLARLCRATPGELVELHRRWVLADAVRGRKEAGAASASSAADEAADDAAAPAPGEPVMPTPAQAPVPDRRPFPRPRRRVRTLLLAALTVTALLGTAAAAVHLSTGDGSDRSGEGSAAGPATAARTDAPGDRVPAPDATHPTDPARPAGPSHSSSPAAVARPGDGPSAPHTARTPDRGDTVTSTAPPLAITTHPYAWPDPCSQHYLIDRPPADVSPPPLEQDAPAYVAVHKAVSAGKQYVTFTVQGTGSATVVLEQLSVRMAGRRAPLAWNDYAMGYPGVGCGGGMRPRSFTLALDALRPQAVPESGQPGFPFKVSRSDPEEFHITADASAYDVSWYLELAWSSGTRHGTLRIDDNGRPFRTSGNNGRPAYAFPLGGEKWQPASGTDAG
ncbi:helix-turn-helix domain-containing protein [Streptomyces sp. NPDC051133]|uniref:helix-turn-helix domain-containing protein n=1 Tax=Streptomyces sp. NPDC051133 TaxID=3155521 RepID=UPI00344AAA13